MKNKVILVILIIMMLLLSIFSFCSCDVTKPQQTISFDLSGFKSHGRLSCDRIWVQSREWDDEIDKEVDMFYYLDAEGNAKSGWFSCEEYIPHDFVNDLVWLEGKSKSSTDYEIHLFYDINFSPIGSVKARNYPRHDFNFNHYGIAFAYGIDMTNYKFKDTEDLMWIDKDGIHHFSKDIHLSGSPSHINTTDKYFIIDDEIVCHRNGEKIIDLHDIIIENYRDDYRLKNYEYIGYDFRNTAIDNDIASFEFKAENKKSQSEVWFSCAVDLNGKVIREPSKITSGD